MSSKTIQPVSTIELTDRENVVFLFANNGLKEVFKAVDIIESAQTGQRYLITVRDRENTDRLLQFDSSLVETITVGGVDTNYTALDTEEIRQDPAQFKTRYNQILQKLADEVFCGSCGGGSATSATCDDVTIESEGRGGDPNTSITTVAAGGTFVVPVIDVLDSTDVVEEEVRYGNTVKMMDAAMSAAVVGTQVQISSGSGIQAQCITIWPPGTTASEYSGDFKDLWDTGVFDFYDPSTAGPQRILGADNYTLDASTPNQWGTTDRFVDVDGNGSDVHGILTWASFPSGWDYIVLDTLHDVMWYQANLDANIDWETSLDEVAAQNTAVFKGFSDWFCPPQEIFLQSAVPDPSGEYYANENMFRRGIVSGVLDSSAWLCRPNEYDANAFYWAAAADWRRSAKTTTTGRGVYMCRFIQPSDSYLP